MSDQEESARPMPDLELNFAVDTAVALSELHLLAESNFDEGEYEGALMRYIEVFEGSRGLPEWQDKRLNIVLADMAALADVYEPAMLALKSMRDEKEAALFSANAKWNNISEWAAFNRQLEPDRTMAIYFRLKANPSKNGPTLSLIRQIESSNFLRQGLYQELDQETLAHLQKKVLLQESVLLSPEEEKEEEEEFLENAIETLLEEALELFEAAAALKEGDIGREAMKKYLAYQQEDKAYSKLIIAAKRAQNQAWVDGLQKLAADEKT